MAGPLTGIRVIDAAQMYAAPGLGMYLADFGADVVKVEPPAGDTSRGMHTAPGLGDFSKPFLHLNRNKRSISVDIRKPEGRDILLRMLRTADVFITNLRTGVPERLGIGYDAVEKLNPRLIYVSLTAWGAAGPRRQRPGYDLLIQARAGFLDARRYPDGSPVSPALMAADPSVPLLMAYGVMMALYERDRSGRGQKVESSLFAATIAMQNHTLVRLEREPSLPSTGNKATHIHRCSDDKYLIVIIITNEEWDRFCRATGLDKYADDPRFGSYMGRADNHETITAMLKPVFETMPRDHWTGLLAEHDVPCEPIVSREELLADPQARVNGYLVDMDDPRVGRMTTMGLPLSLSRTPGELRRFAPRLGEQTDEILHELGLTSQEIEKLRKTNVVK